jgi:hypothetical protein
MPSDAVIEAAIPAAHGIAASDLLAAGRSLAADDFLVADDLLGLRYQHDTLSARHVVSSVLSSVPCCRQHRAVISITWSSASHGRQHHTA